MFINHETRLINEVSMDIYVNFHCISLLIQLDWNFLNDYTIIWIYTHSIDQR